MKYSRSFSPAAASSAEESTWAARRERLRIFLTVCGNVSGSGSATAPRLFNLSSRSRRLLAAALASRWRALNDALSLAIAQVETLSSSFAISGHTAKFKLTNTNAIVVVSNHNGRSPRPHCWANGDRATIRPKQQCVHFSFCCNSLIVGARLLRHGWPPTFLHSNYARDSKGWIQRIYKFFALNFSKFTLSFLRKHI